MFCYKCGKKIPDDSSFCSFCGVAIGTATANPPADTRSNTEMNRDALKIYLSDLLALECQREQYEEMLPPIDKEIEALIDNWAYNVYQLADSNCYLHFRYMNDQVHMACVMGYNHEWEPYTEEKLKNDPMEPICWSQLTGFGTYVRYYSEVRDWANVADKALISRRKARKAYMDAFDHYLQNAPKIREKEVKILDAKCEYRKQILARIQSMKERLDEAYSLNIVPAQFRYKGYAIYYLHSFVTTSQESFSSALLHCDLDAIKSRLDAVVSNQKATIIQQAMIAAQNNQLIQQNQAQLQRLAKIERNTQWSTMYTKIAAYNSDTCAWFARRSSEDVQDLRKKIIDV